MAMPITNLVGQRFSMLVVTRLAANDGQYTCWWVQCDCGNISVVRASHLKSGNTQSCGCLSKAHYERYLAQTKKSNIAFHRTAMRNVKEKL